MIYAFSDWIFSPIIFKKNKSIMLYSKLNTILEQIYIDVYICTCAERKPSDFFLSTKVFHKFPVI